MQNHSSKKGLRVLLTAFVSVSALLASAAAGAWMQASLQKIQPELMDARLQSAEHAERESVLLRQNLDLLAEKVGNLQARVIAIDALGQRIAEVAGVKYTPGDLDQSVHDDAGLADESSLAVLPGLVGDDGMTDFDEVTLPSGTVWSAESLDRQLDRLAMRLSEKQDSLALMDAVLTHRSGLDASLPTFRPVDYPYLTSSFGWRRNPVTGRHSMHEGLDFSAPRGTPIYAASGGVVTESRYHPGYGKLVEINHGNGLVTRYAHASSINVKLGQVVAKGEMIARVGSTGRSTGPHLHFEVRMADQPLDPRLFLDQTETPESLLAKVSGGSDADTPQVR